MINYDKTEIRDVLEIENIFELLQEWGGDPEYTNFGILSSTICHNEPGEGSRKLYYYANSGLFRCYTGCDNYFDIFELTRKIANIQWSEEYDLNDAVRWVARRFGIAGRLEDGTEDEEKLDDWLHLARYDKLKEIEVKNNIFELKEFNSDILERFNYDVIIKPWLDEGISQEVIKLAKIGYYPGGEQITIPHFDINNKFIGLRGRTLIAEEAETFGKYRPIRVNKTLYNHPLGMNLYGINWNKDSIKTMEKAIIFESEKSVLMYASYFGWDNNIAVACCGSSLSNKQMQLLKDLGVKEVVIAFDRQFQELGDKECKHLTKNLTRLNDKYKQDMVISFIFDKNMITGYKASPIDEGANKFLQLFKERIVL